MGFLFANQSRISAASIKMQNEAGEYVDLYVPRKCSASNRIIAAKDIASIQLIIADVDEKTGRMLSTNKTYAICGAIRRMGESDDCLARREAIAGKLDRSFDMFGVHVGLKYKDPSDRLKGGELRVAIDDMKALFPRAHSKRIDVNLKVDGGASKTDGLFDLTLIYLLEHGDGDGDETGTLSLTRAKQGDTWVSQLKTKTTGNHKGRSIIPEAITNAQLDVKSDRRTKFNLKYVNPTKNRDLEIDVNRVPGKQATIKITKDGNALVDLTFSADDLDLRRPDGNFKVGVDGTVAGDAVSGSVQGEKSPKGYRVKIDLSKGNRKALQVDSKVKADPANSQYSTKTIYSAMGGVIQGTIMMKYENKEFTFSNTDKNTKDKVELRVYLNPGEKLEIEGKKNGESMWTYKTLRSTVNTDDKFELTLNTDLTLNSKSVLWTMMDKYYPYGAFNTRRNVPVPRDRTDGDRDFRITRRTLRDEGTAA